VFSILGSYFIIVGFLILGKSFIVLGAEAIVFKKRTGRIKGFNWEDIGMFFYTTHRKKRDYRQVHISFPNGEKIWIGNPYPLFFARFYESKEFPNHKIEVGNLKYYCFFLTFRAYYNYAKKGIFEI
jgi:hypothetical protein